MLSVLGCPSYVFPDGAQPTLELVFVTIPAKYFVFRGQSSYFGDRTRTPMKFPDQNTESERTALGAKASYDCKIGQVEIIPEVSATWQHEFGDTAYAASLASGAANSFTVTGRTLDAAVFESARALL